MRISGGGEGGASASTSRAGRVTDFFGERLTYDGTATNVQNSRGALASCGNKASKFHDELCRRLREHKDAIYEKAAAE